MRVSGHQGPREALESALEAAVRRLGVTEVPDLELQRSRAPEHGDYSTSASMKLARVLRRPPPRIAADLAEAIELPGGEAAWEAVGGYVNFRLTPAYLRALVGAVAADPVFGSSRAGAGQRVQVEFVSTNPTGPLHIGHGRGAILGDAIAALLAFTGHRVEREYYVNDHGTQARKFGESLHARFTGAQPPEGGYLGDYVAELAERARADLPGLAAMGAQEATDALREYGAARIVEQFRATLERLGVRYDHWWSERALWEEGLPQRALERLRERGFLRRRDGAIWFAPALEEEGSGREDEDRVVIRSDGLHTYFASDLGYLLSKFEERGFDRVIDVWGADHHGYVPRIKGAMAALGLDPEGLVVILNQMVNLKAGKMSKRAGRFVTLDELVDLAGVDAVRFFYLLRSPDAMMEFDLELAASEGNENPVYYAQYAHARLSGIERAAAERHPDLPAGAGLDLLGEPGELAVARVIAHWPEVVDTAARLLEPHRVPYYVRDLADAVHAWYHAGNEDPGLRVVVDDAALTRARLELCRAARQTLRIALELLGVAAPERM